MVGAFGKSTKLTSEEDSLFKAVVLSHSNLQLKPLKVSRQVVGGTNYRYECVDNGSVRKLGCKQQAYAHSFVNLKRKKGISATPLNWLLNAFTLALNDSAPALVCLFTK